MISFPVSNKFHGRENGLVVLLGVWANVFLGGLPFTFSLSPQVFRQLTVRVSKKYRV